MLELKILLSEVVPKFRFEIEETTPTAGIVLRPSGQMRAKVRRRS